MIHRIVTGVLGVLTGGLMAGIAAAQSFLFTTVEVDGNIRIPDETVINVAGVQTGEPLSGSDVNDIVLRLQASGLFETVEVVPSGSRLILLVTELPTINQVNIEGNERLSDEFLLGVIESAPREIYSQLTAESDARAIADAYADASRLSAVVTPALIRRSENRVDLVFEVAESRVVENERISFVGNRAFSDRRLRRVVATKQAGRLRTFIGSDTLIEDRTLFDATVLTEFYRSRGFADFRVLDISSEFSRERDASFVTFNVREGQRFTFGDITAVSEVPGVDIAPFADALRVKPGRTWNPAIVDLEVTRLERLALREGLDFVRVDPRITRNDRERTLDLEFALIVGPRVFVERIDIEGNETTLDRVIRRQFDTVEGDPFNPRSIQASAARIRALGFFSDVTVDTGPGSEPDQVVVDVDVVEQPTGSLTFGGSFSDDSGIGFNIGFSERNFLGRGQSLSVQIQSGDESGRTSFSIVEPAFLGRDLTFGFTGLISTTDFDNTSFETEIISFSPSIRFRTGENSTLRLSYTIASETISDVSEDASPILAAEVGKEVQSSVGYDFVYNTINGGLNPNAGVLLEFGQEFAGLGGNVQLIETTGRAVAQRNIFNEEVTIRAIVEGGFVTDLGDGATRVSDRFFLSSRQLRGFAARGVGPRDLGAVDDDVLGGNKFFSARFEADFPLGLPEEYGITGGVFADFGSLWELDNTSGVIEVDDDFELRSSIGFSVFWTSPIGPLRMNFAAPIQSNPADEENVFDVSLSTNF